MVVVRDRGVGGGGVVSPLQRRAKSRGGKVANLHYASVEELV